MDSVLNMNWLTQKKKFSPFSERILYAESAFQAAACNAADNVFAGKQE